MKRSPDWEAIKARIGSKWAPYRIRPEDYPSTPGLKRYEASRKANAQPTLKSHPTSGVKS